MNFFDLLKHTSKEVGHGIAVAAKATEKPLEVAGKIAVEVAVTAAPLAFPASLPLSLPISKAVSTIFQTSIEGDTMNPLESFAITMVLGIIQSTVKNPAHKAALKGQLVGIADLIFTEYGMAAPVALDADPVGH